MDIKDHTDKEINAEYSRRFISRCQQLGATVISYHKARIEEKTRRTVYNTYASEWAGGWVQE